MEVVHPIDECSHQGSIRIRSTTAMWCPDCGGILVQGSGGWALPRNGNQTNYIHQVKNMNDTIKELQDIIEDLNNTAWEKSE